MRERERERNRMGEAGVRSLFFFSLANARKNILIQKQHHGKGSFFGGGKVGRQKMSERLQCRLLSPEEQQLYNKSKKPLE